MAIKRQTHERAPSEFGRATLRHRRPPQVARMMQFALLCSLLCAILATDGFKFALATTPTSLTQVIKSAVQAEPNTLQSNQNQNQLNLNLNLNQNPNNLNQAIIFQPQSQQQQQQSSQFFPMSNQSYNNLRSIANLLNQRAIITAPPPPSSPQPLISNQVPNLTMSNWQQLQMQQQQQQQLALLQSQQDQQTLQQALAGQSPTTSGSFQLKLLGSINDTLFVNLSPIEGANNHQPRIEFRSQQFAQQQQQHAAGNKAAPFVPTVTLDERVQNNTFVAAVVTNDPDAGPSGEVELSIERGNEMSHFKLAKLTATSNTHTILVSGAPLNAYELNEYNLTLVARDKGQPPKFSSANLLIKLNASSLQSPMTRSYANAMLDGQHQLHHMHQFSAKEAELTHVAIMLVIIFFLSIFITVIVCALVRTRHTIKDKCGQLSQSQPARASSSTTTTTTATAATHLRSNCRDHCLCLGHTNL